MVNSVSSLANLGQIMEHFKPQLLAMLQRRIDPKLAVRMDAEDILAETFIAARNRWPSVEADLGSSTDGSILYKKQYAWLYRLARDTLIEMYRRNVMKKRDLKLELHWSDSSSSHLGSVFINKGTSPSAAVMRAELQQNICRTCGLLKEKEQEILWMRHADQLSFPEIGMVLGVTENAASVRYLRALIRLSELWHSLHPESSQP
jgi:RNA polymerase sigma-70 factor, ECF subfamily